MSATVEENEPLLDASSGRQAGLFSRCRRRQPRSPHNNSWIARQLPASTRLEIDDDYDESSHVPVRPVPDTTEGARVKLDRRFFSRTGRIVRLLYAGDLWSFKVWLSHSLVVGCMLAVLFVLDFQADLFSTMTVVISHRDGDEFEDFLFQVIGISVGMAIASSILAFLGGIVSYHWRNKLTPHLHHLYFDHRLFYRLIMIDDRVDNPDQRIAADSRAFCENLSTLVIQITSGLINFVYFGAEFIFLVGVPTFLSLVVLAFVMMLLFNRLATPVARLVFRQDVMEGDYRYVHGRIRQYAESIAFFRGEDNERSILDRTFSAIVRVSKSLIWKRASLIYMATFMITLTISLVYGLVFFLSVLPRHGVFNTDDPEVLTRYFMLALIRCIISVASLLMIMANAKVFTDFAGNATRIAQMLEVAQDVLESSRIADSRHIISEPNAVEFRDITVTLPNGRVLIKDLNLRVGRGDHLLITGPTGSGKTTLCRVLAGVWIPESGEVLRPSDPAGLFHLPQRPLILPSSLRVNLWYPVEPQDTPETEERMLSVLKLVGLRHLIRDRSGMNWDADIDWTTLSGGEQQRLSIARLLFHKPRFAVLDESTGAVDVATEARLSQICRHFDITMITISHRQHVRRFHEHVLSLAGDGTGAWQVEQVPETERAPDLVPGNGGGSGSAAVLGREDDGSGDNPLLDLKSLARLPELEPLPDTDPGGELMRSALEATKHERDMSGKSIGSSQGRRHGRDGSVRGLWRGVGKVLPVAEGQDQVTVAGFDGGSKGSLSASPWRSVLPMLFPKKSSQYGPEPGTSSLALFIWAVVFALVTSLGQQAIFILFGVQVNFVVHRDVAGFTTIWVIRIALALLMAFPPALVSVFTDVMALRWRIRLTLQACDDYMQRMTYYRVQMMSAQDRSEFDNADQRIAEDVRSFSEQTATAITIGAPTAISAPLYLVGILIFLGPIPLALILFSLLLIAPMISMLMKPVARKQYEQDKREGDFRYLHLLLVKNVEAVAFYDHGSTEYDRFDRSFRFAQSNYLRLLYKKLQMELVSRLLRLIVTLATFTALAYPVFTRWRAYDTDDSSELMRLIGASMGALLAVGQVVDGIITKFLGPASLAMGNVRRVVSMFDVFRAPDKRREAALGRYRDGSPIELKHVNVEAPDGSELLHDFSTRFQHSTLITGPSGVGKSSLLRVIAGLWPMSVGTIIKPTKHDPQHLMFFSQVPYLVLGSLRDQITYPIKLPDVPPDGNLHAQLYSCLERASCAYLFDSRGSWDAVESWPDVLSGGEAQRIALARAFYHEPAILVLDEASSALDADTEARVYSELAKLPNTVMISVAHRVSLKKYHTNQLEFVRPPPSTSSPSSRGGSRRVKVRAHRS